MTFISRLLRKAPSSERADPTSGPKASEAEVTVAPGPDVSGLALDDVLALAFDAAHPSSREAQKQIIEWLDSGSVSVDRLPTDPTRLRGSLALAAATTEGTHFDTLAAQIADPAVWVEIASNGSTARLRQLAAARVEAPDELRAVMKAARERDKNVYRIAKTKLDEIHAATKRAELAKQHMLSLAETIEHHSYKPFDGAYVAAIEHLEREWRALDIEIPSETQSRVQAAIDRARNTIAEHIRAVGARAAHEAAVANAAPLRAGVIDELRKLLSALYSAERFDAAGAASVAERLAKLHRLWTDTLQYRAADTQEAREFEALRHAVERVSQSMSESGSVIQQLESMRDQASDASAERLRQSITARGLLGESVPAVVLEAEAATQQWAEEQQAKRVAAAENEKQIAQLIRKAQAALTAGRSRQAFGIRRSIDAKLARLAHPPKHLTERLQQLDAKLEEIQDWRSFAVTPKRSELIEQMQALIGSDEEPAQLAEQIKRLQEEWKSLAKGSQDSEEDWTKFHDAAQAAYAPCKVFFEAQAQERERHLEQKKALLAKLEQYERTTDWEQVEWKNVANAVRTARQEWRSAGHSDRAATRAIEKQFDALLAKVQARLDAQYASNLERKQSLVKQAQRLAAVDDLVQATNEVKRLQSAWRAVGLTPHAEGQKLWDEFKQLCDAVFDKRRKEHTDRMAELEQNEEQALALCIELETLAHRSGAELFASGARVRELREAFNAIGELPRDKAHEIQRRFKRGMEEFEHAIVQERQREADKSWDNFFDAANRIRLAQLEGNTDLSTLREHIASIQHWPKGGRQVIEQRLATQVDTDLAQNAEALRSIAIRAEIAAGAGSPETDQSLRRAMQLQALVKGIGRGSATPGDQVEALAFEWATIGPVATAVYDDLFARFKRAWALARK